MGIAALVFLISGGISAQDATKPADGTKPKAEAGAGGEQKSAPAAIAKFSDAANLQNNGAFDLAIEEWTDFLAKFPGDPLAPKAQYYLAVCHVELKQFAKSATLLEALLKAQPKFEFAEDAYMQLGWSQYSLAGGKPEQYAVAEATLKTLSEKFPNTKHADQVAYFVGECRYHQNRKPEAIASYETVVKKFPMSTFRCDALYAMGVAHEELNQIAEAGKAYDLYLAECASGPSVNEVRLRKAETMLRQGQFAEAGQLFATVAAVPNFASADLALVRQADCLVRQEKLDEAIGVYTRVVNSYPNSPQAVVAMASAGRVLFRGEKLGEAAGWFERAIAANHAESAESAHWLAKIKLRQKKPQEALAVVDAMLEKSAQSPWRLALTLDRWDALYDMPDRRVEAIAGYTKLASENPKHELAPQALYNAAFGELEVRQFERARANAAEFLTRYPQDRLLPDVKYIMAESLLLLNKLGDAQPVYRELLAAFPQNADRGKWQVRLALVLLLEKKYPDVVTLLKPELGALPSPELVAEAQFLIGSSQFAQDQAAEAGQAFQASLTTQPKWRQADETLLGLARAQRKLEKIAEARGTIQKLIQEFPMSGILDQAWYRHGEFAYAQADYPAALAAYDHVLKTFPQSPYVPFAQYGKGWTLIKQKQYPAATEILSAMLTTAPQHALAPDARFARAMSRRQSNDFNGAVEDLQAYLQGNLDADRKADALYERGLAEVGAMKLDAAVGSFQQVLREHPKYASSDKVRYELAWAWKSQEKAEEAAAEFGRIAQLFPESPLVAESLFHVAESQYDRKDFAESAKNYAQTVGRSKSVELTEKANYKLGWSQFQLKQYDAALNQFSAQLAASPQGPLAGDGRFMKAECLFRMQKFSEAYQGFEAARQAGMIPARLESLLLLHAGQSAGQLKMWKESLELLAQIPQKYADSPYVVEARYEMGWARQNLKQTDDAMKDYEFAAINSRDAVGARARFMMGELLFEKKQFDEAIKQFQRVMFTYGGENAVADVKVWQAQAGYEAGRCWEVQISTAPDPKRKSQCVAEASRQYHYVVEKHPQSPSAAEAKKRLETLTKL
jgi:TolA-binding protein